MSFIIGLLLAGLVLLTVSLQRTYMYLPVKELKRRARDQDATAAILHQAAVYGLSLRAILWLLVVLSSAGFFVFAAGHWPTWLALIASGGLVYAAFVWLPNREVKSISLWFATTLAPVFAWLLQYLHSPVNWLHRQLRKFLPGHHHTGLYDKDDLLDLMKHQEDQADNRIPEVDLQLAVQALTFSDKLVSDFLTPRRAVKLVSVDDSIGPILMAELHDSGFSRFPVYEGKKDRMVGTLFLKDLVNTKSTAKVKDVMRRKVCYVHEDQTLQDALQAILRTHHHLLIVVNSFEEYTGILTIEDIFEQVIGNAIVDEFDQYEDLRAVAARAAQKEHQAHTEKPKASEEATEVIE